MKLHPLLCLLTLSAFTFLPAMCEEVPSKDAPTNAQPDSSSSDSVEPAAGVEKTISFDQIPGFNLITEVLYYATFGEIQITSYGPIDVGQFNYNSKTGVYDLWTAGGLADLDIVVTEVPVFSKLFKDNGFGTIHPSFSADGFAGMYVVGGTIRDVNAITGTPFSGDIEMIAVGGTTFSIEGDVLSILGVSLISVTGSVDADLQGTGQAALLRTGLWMTDNSVQVSSATLRVSFQWLKFGKDDSQPLFSMPILTHPFGVRIPNVYLDYLFGKP